MNRPKPWSQHRDFEGLISLDESMQTGREPLDTLIQLAPDENHAVVGFRFWTHGYPDSPSTLELYLFDWGKAGSVKQAIDQQGESVQVWKHEVEWEGGFDALLRRTFARASIVVWNNKLLGQRSVEILGGD